MPMNQQVSIIILNWNNLSFTRKCLHSLLKVKDIPFRIIVIDNGSDKDEAAALSTEFITNKDVILITRLEKNRGFTGGCNYGFELAKKDHPQFYLLLNNDTEVEPDFLKHLVATAESNPRIGIVSPVVYDFYHKNNILFSGGKINWFLARPYHLTQPLTKASEFDVLTGCCLLIKAQVYEKIGGLDDRFFAYFEDTAFCLKAKQKGYTCVCDPKAKIYHCESASSGKKSVFYTYLFSRNRILFIKHYLPIKKQLYYMLFFFCKCLTVCVYFLLKRQTALAKVYYRGYIQGMKDEGGIPNL